MHKLSLYLDDLRVESFDTLPAAAGLRRTVRGHQESVDSCEGNRTCGGEDCNAPAGSDDDPSCKDVTFCGGFTCNGGQSCDTECTDHTCNDPTCQSCESVCTDWCCSKA